MSDPQLSRAEQIKRFEAIIQGFDAELIRKGQLKPLPRLKELHEVDPHIIVSTGMTDQYGRYPLHMYFEKINPLMQALGLDYE